MSLLNDALRDLEKRERAPNTQQPVSPGLSAAGAKKRRAAGRKLLVPGLAVAVLMAVAGWWLGIGKNHAEPSVTQQAAPAKTAPAAFRVPAALAAKANSMAKPATSGKAPMHPPKTLAAASQPQPKSEPKPVARRIAAKAARAPAKVAVPKRVAAVRKTKHKAAAAKVRHPRRQAVTQPPRHPPKPVAEQVSRGPVVKAPGPQKVRSSLPLVAAIKQGSSSPGANSDPAGTNVITPAPLSPAQRDQALAHRLSTLVQQGNVAAAVGLLAARVADGGDWQRSRQALVGALLAQKDYAPAGQFLTPRITRTYPDLRLLKGRLLLATLGPARALRYLQTDIPDIDTWPQYHVTLATLLQQTGHSLKAAQVWSALLQIDNANAAWWAGLGIALDGTGQDQRARQAFRQALLLPGLNAALNQYVRQRLAKMPQS